jgi:hypothetical protein
VGSKIRVEAPGWADTGADTNPTATNHAIARRLENAEDRIKGFMTMVKPTMTLRRIGKNALTIPAPAATVEGHAQ